MNCPQAEQFFDAYLDHELSGSLRLEFDAHRLHCPLCQQKLAMMESCEHILSSDDHSSELSEDFTERVMAEISGQPLPIARLRRRRIVIAATVLVQTAAVIGLVIFWRAPVQDAPQPVGFAVNPARVNELIEQKDAVALHSLIGDGAEALRSGFAVAGAVRDVVRALPEYARRLDVPESTPGENRASIAPWFLRPFFPAAAPAKPDGALPKTNRIKI